MNRTQGPARPGRAGSPAESPGPLGPGESSYLIRVIPAQEEALRVLDQSARDPNRSGQPNLNFRNPFGQIKPPSIMEGGFCLITWRRSR